MTPLAVYIRAIHGMPSRATLLSRECAEETGCDDAGCFVSRRTLCRFADGVTIQYDVERDDAPQEGACLSCLLLCRVLETGEGDGVSPMRKRFESDCQFRFWLALQSDPADKPSS
ncbi:hypothetical protein [Paludibacterium paludis]|uniref:Uncharacterized protein n=1 Tax=Paludibacterium paludis TaxID=1225769 RepID=A0A918P3R5_9NEIS|nr:hypothetical protein [Paludibacterium paludis]GGY17147.1 hypothetical protein GCM10011289_20610 [Paludibacterium paludis]